MATDNNVRIAKNTLYLFFRQILIMIVTLYSSRVVLNALGVEDFGLYTAVGGFVAMFGIISNSLTVAISRFLTYEMGAGRNENLNKIFSSAILIQLILALLLVLIAETAGVWFLNTQMTIPSSRVYASNWVFQFSVFAFLVNLIIIPYNASIVAHEKMAAFAYIGIVQAFGILVISLLISFSSFDRLIFYALLMALLPIFIWSIYKWYCKKNFNECNFIFIWDLTLIKQIFSFAGWNFIGASSSILRDQGTNVLLNIFCGPIVNAARGVSMQVSSAVTHFVSSFMTALNPGITKSYAAGDNAQLKVLVYRGARFSCYLLLILSLPILAETNYILELWLRNVPAYTVIFVRLILIYSLVDAISYTLITLMLATGNIKNYQLLVGGFQLLNFPTSYILLKLDFSPESTIVASIFIAIICLVLRLIMLKMMVSFNEIEFIKKVVINVVLVTVISLVIPYVITISYEECLIRFLLCSTICVIETATIVFFIGCSKEERNFIINRILTFINGLKK